MKNIIKFFREKGLAILLLSVIFTFSSLFWMNDIVYNRKDLGAIELGWPISFVVQNHSQLDPPEYWFPRKIGFGLPQEYSTSLNFLPFVFSVVLNFLIIFSIVFIILKFSPRLLFLRKIISVKYIVGAIGATLFIFISLFIYMYFTRPQIDIGILPLVISSPQPTEGVAQWFENNFKGIGDRNVHGFANFIGIDSFIFQAEGLFMFDGLIFEKGGYLYQFDVNYDNLSESSRNDFYKIISTAEFLPL